MCHFDLIFKNFFDITNFSQHENNVPRETDIHIYLRCCKNKERDKSISDLLKARFRVSECLKVCVAQKQKKQGNSKTNKQGDKCSKSLIVSIKRFSECHFKNEIVKSNILALFHFFEEKLNFNIWSIKFNFLFFMHTFLGKNKSKYAAGPGSGCNKNPL